MTKMSEIKASMRAHEAELKYHGEIAIKEMFQEFFDLHPDVVAIRWTQYTPYFNDGSACVFEVGEFEIGIASSNPDIEELNNLDSDDVVATLKLEINGKFIPVTFFDTYSLVNRIKIDFQKLSKEIDDELFKIVFGEHSEVTVTRDRILIEEYEEHD